MAHGSADSHYLGLPFQIGRSKKQVFQFVIDRVRKKLNGWKEKFLTKAEKEVLIKSVIQAIPNHVMMCYLLPDGVCDDIMSLVRRFWWGKSSESRSICWKSWDSMCAPKSMGGMGFKDIRATHKSLLAKQGWRMVTQPDSLLAKVFEARYFPKQDFMHAVMGHRPSYLWRSFLAGRAVLELGIRFQVGSGETIKVWDDKWLPTPYNFKPHLFHRQKWPEVRVHELMLPEVNAWNQELLNYLFLPHDIHSILQIPLCTEAIHDRLVWHHTRNGVYTVKSGYAVLKRYQALQKDDTSHNMHPKSSVWNTLWNWRMLPKIKHFAWQAMHNILPLGENLALRLDVRFKCPHCSCAYETDKHIFQLCPFARKVWTMLGLHYIWDKWDVSSMCAFITAVLNEEDEHVASLVLITLWLLWKARCTLLYDQQPTTHMQLILNAHSLLQELAQLPKSSDNAQDYLDAWLPPPQGMLTLNVDASVNENGQTGYGAIIRNSEGVVLASSAGPLQQNIDVEKGELLAIWKGIQLALGTNVTCVVVFTDSRQAHNRLLSTEEDYSLLSPIVRHIELLASQFDCTSFEYVRRQGNVPAHLLAKIGLSLANDVFWGSTPPPSVLHAVFHDSHVHVE